MSEIILPEPASVSDQVRPRRFFPQLRQVNTLFMLTVVMPTVLAVLYFGVIASDVFLSESHFVVRGPQRTSAAGLTSLLQGVSGGFSRSVEDSYSVTDFMISRDALRSLEDELNLTQAFGSDGIDILSRFAGLDRDDSFEALHRYYQKMVGVTVDAASPISVLSVRAFSAEDAFRINERLLELSEQLVNTLNARARQDMIQFAQSVVADAEQRARTAAERVSEFRHRQSVFDPEKQSAIQLERVSVLQGELSISKTRLAQIRSLAKNNPQIDPLQKMVDATEAEIASETAKVVGGRVSLADKAVEYEGLVLEQELAAKQLETSLISLVQARDEAQRKQLYLERIVQPSMPDVALEPRRIRSIVATLILGLIGWGMLSLVVAGVREHHD
ncbi:capsule biosynthesis protein [uncultured Lamprocystis sp.]|jgi:capsular polysaccharide transport system permease protein|uniref:capsule biosynthesis protein n=1 Tax=uncultured Lamprocystis sp. TaxID=543132 RepID=UPI0025EEB2F0|nr:capsule biosynthesis protein [uncultured Lamprocystis sp.]